MKKYRCLWCKSTANHNIWCFHRTSGVGLQNLPPPHKTQPILLWKAQTALLGAVSTGSKLPKIQCNRGSGRVASQAIKPMPLWKWRTRRKIGANTASPVGVVDIEDLLSCTSGPLASKLLKTPNQFPAPVPEGASTTSC